MGKKAVIISANMSYETIPELNVIALAGGVGGARMACGLAALLPPERLTVIVNTGDDFTHWGLTICPDIDTVLYNLAGLANPKTGWGLRAESYTCLAAVEKLGGPGWFRLGDRDLATHLMRTEMLRGGARLTEATRRLADNLGIRHAVLPMSDTPCPTIVISDEGELDFQTYFVQRACEPPVRALRWENADTAEATPEVQAALEKADLVVICPSNPFVSIDPILNLPGVRAAVRSIPTLAISPILGGRTIKGPAAKMFAELGHATAPTARDVAAYYQDLLDGFVLDQLDSDLTSQIEALGVKAAAMPTLMLDLARQTQVARGMLKFGARLAKKMS